jgi:hypothetical protein
MDGIEIANNKTLQAFIEDYLPQRYLPLMSTIARGPGNPSEDTSLTYFLYQRRMEIMETSYDRESIRGHAVHGSRRLRR